MPLTPPLVARLVAAQFLAGSTINLHADHALRTLCRPGEDRYRIPGGPPLRCVAVPYIP
jgi:hypothetical protein